MARAEPRLADEFDAGLKHIGHVGVKSLDTLAFVDEKDGEGADGFGGAVWPLEREQSGVRFNLEAAAAPLFGGAFWDDDGGATFTNGYNDGRSLGARTQSTDGRFFFLTLPSSSISSSWSSPVRMASGSGGSVR